MLGQTQRSDKDREFDKQKLELELDQTNSVILRHLTWLSQYLSPVAMNGNEMCHVSCNW